MMKIIRDGQTITLSQQELKRAYEVWQHKLDMDFIATLFEDLTEDEIPAVAYQYRDDIDYADTGMAVYDCLVEIAKGAYDLVACQPH